MDSFDKLSEEKRNSILNICMDAFIQNGYAQANTVEIAKQCGIAKGSLFHYFGSKKALFLYVIKVCMDRVMNETSQALSRVEEQTYFSRVRKSVEIKMALPQKYPRETALLTRGFSERGHEASEELYSMLLEYSSQVKKLNSMYVGEIEQEFVKDEVNINDARVYIQMIFDGMVTRLMQQYAQNPKALLDNPKILSDELEKTIGFIMHGIGK